MKLATPTNIRTVTPSIFFERVPNAIKYKIIVVGNVQMSPATIVEFEINPGTGQGEMTSFQDNGAKLKQGQKFVAGK